MRQSEVISRLTGIYGGGVDAQDNNQDDEANYFARCLLMPRELVKQEVTRLGGINNDGVVSALAKRFGVEEAMMGMRLVEVYSDGRP